ncbi:PTS system mannose/fructose/sorbose family transporter subunit IID [Clostridium gasigenes]|uniref:Phosphotransferase system, mannose/fructose/N-acetylgalactosamine-specific component IID n=1 Tax=Clostridium gasigenes TaxID=94869 RepID=A0A1H0VN59_9CLOT|nr:PTS system mannose/fructose/sorbose family transporter subunit IID [Clostridium gasigenes]MBU3089600.1 PTS system mannose/fructose/sorbose family transporter subunit IID [Clostridium gasigenes]MBU3106007.1 PTS system mannose/fructose/sorbose family transporter subunit IID [Clostridium gasigenes]MBU3134250.1 PTS system mannose/fructose/sorbose family transporter subunit IID [Clostridium gasigenes]SDP79860.1 Phosphotransferase system, mannose/fructose/N-acetylgalactosamine-specific component I
MGDKIKKLDKATLRKSWWAWYTGNLSSMSFEWLESFGFAVSMIPVIKKLYGDDKEEELKALKRHSSFYNTEPQLGSVINGIVCGLEEERANGADIDDEVINGIKIGLMGPLAGIGDAMIPGMYIPLLLSIAMGLAEGGNPLGPIFYIVTFLTTITALSYFVFLKGYNLGTKSVNLIVGETAQRARESFNLLGSIVVGGVAASYVNVTTALQIPTGAEKNLVVMDVLNGIFPKILPLLLVIFCWFLMSKKKMSPIKVMGVLVGLAIVGVAAKFF